MSAKKLSSNSRVRKALANLTLQKLKYDFINGDIKRAMAKALRFTLSVPGIHTAIVGTSKPGRYNENAKMLAEGTFSKSDFDLIRAQWQTIATPDWVGQV